MRLSTVSWPLGCSCFCTGFAFGGEDLTKKDLAVFRSYLSAKHAGKKWQTGPSRLDSPAIQKAYGNRRFYFVFSAPPLPPGANLPAVQEAYRKRYQEFLKTHLSLTVRIEAKGAVVPLLKIDDYSQGLMGVTTDADARTAAAAVLSLHGSERVGHRRGSQVTGDSFRPGLDMYHFSAESVPGNGDF
jgi:hypothetical protein